MKTTDSKKLDQIITMLGDIVHLFGKRFDSVDEILNEHTKTLDDHTRRLNIIENDVKTNLDKRMQLDVRVTNLEKKFV